MPFEKGNVANPHGGNADGYQLSQRMRKQFHAHFRKHGMGAIERLYEQDPGKYLQLGVSLLPKEMHVALDQGFSEVLQLAAQQLALQHKPKEKELPIIEGETVTPVIPDKSDGS